jgi:hypothetical protein
MKYQKLLGKGSICKLGKYQKNHPRPKMPCLKREIYESIFTDIEITLIIYTIKHFSKREMLYKLCIKKKKLFV